GLRHSLSVGSLRAPSDDRWRGVDRHQRNDGGARVFLTRRMLQLQRPIGTTLHRRGRGSKNRPAKRTWRYAAITVRALADRDVGAYGVGDCFALGLQDGSLDPSARR